MKNKKDIVVVTGGAGFIGSHLIESLIEDFDVISIDNYFTGSKENHISGAEYINGNASDIKSILKGRTFPKYIFHLGEYSRVEQSFDDVEKVWNFNKNGIFSVLEYVRSSGSKLIYAGSSTKYGDGGLGRSQSPYAWTKASNTELVVNYGSWYNIQYAITYFYNVYGPREISHGKYATLIALFLDKYKKNKKLTVVSPGTQKRNFTHVSDIVSGLLLIAKHGLGDEFGIGADKSYSILEVAEMFEADIEMLPERRGNRMTADTIVEKTKKLGWKQKHDLESYIKSIIL